MDMPPKNNIIEFQDNIIQAPVIYPTTATAAGLIAGRLSNSSEEHM